MFPSRSAILLSVTLAIARVSGHPTTPSIGNVTLKRQTVVGQATWFEAQGEVGACGVAEFDTDFIVWLSPVLFATGADCGRTVIIVNNGKAAKGTVTDMSLPGTSESFLWLSQSMFAFFADLGTGTIDASPGRLKSK
ncbi:hypothetical protein B0H14DRAFT_2643562 [Mycena olivaceomarginata]|nr:hypothetical protein B0H14DRAFT_2643562 [Mycena olivaceomarginata]